MRRALHDFLEGVAAGVVGIIAATAIDLAIKLWPTIPLPLAALGIFAVGLAIAYVWKSKLAVLAVIAVSALAGLDPLLDIDPGRDRLELAHPFAQVRDLDPPARRGKPALGAALAQLEPLEVEPAVPRLEPGPARRAETGDDTCGRWLRGSADPSLFLLPERLDLARQIVVLGGEMVVDRHHPAVVGVEFARSSRGRSGAGRRPRPCGRTR